MPRLHGCGGRALELESRVSCNFWQCRELGQASALSRLFILPLGKAATCAWAKHQLRLAVKSGSVLSCTMKREKCLWTQLVAMFYGAGNCRGASWMCEQCVGFGYRRAQHNQVSASVVQIYILLMLEQPWLVYSQQGCSHLMALSVVFNLASVV